MKDLSILISKRFFFNLASLKKAGQGVRHCICHFLAIIYIKMVSKKLLCQANLPEAQAFGMYESTQVVVVSEH